jgi:hypothetical protein
MPKTQRIERCVGCGRKVGVLTPDNKIGLNQIITAVQKFIENPPPSDKKDACLSLCTNRTMVDDKAGITYSLCADCCVIILEHVLTGLVRKRKEILFQSFDKIKEKLRDV